MLPGIRATEELHTLLHNNTVWRGEGGEGVVVTVWRGEDGEQVERGRREIQQMVRGTSF